jgi:hypothetical protein
MRKKADKAPDSGRLKLLLIDDGTLATPPLMRALTDGGFRGRTGDAELALSLLRLELMFAVDLLSPAIASRPRSLASRGDAPAGRVRRSSRTVRKVRLRPRRDSG